MNIREIKKIVYGRKTVDGAGVKLTRVFSHDDVKDFDPFLLLDSFGSENPEDYMLGFPMHPHRGIETVTYLIDGKIEHKDSIGNKGTIGKGDCQWMTAGSGILHEEMPKATDRLWGAQLWVNLPSKNKMTEPAYHDLPSKVIPLVKEDDVEVRVIAGNYNGNKGSYESAYGDITYLDVKLEPGKSWTLSTKKENTLFVYIMEGSISLGKDKEEMVSEGAAVLTEDGDWFKVKAFEDGARFLLATGPKLKEPIAWGGPIVMNTDEELALAFSELRDNTFIK